MDKVRWGIISTAKIGIDLVIPAMQGQEFCDVTAIASRDLAKAQAVAGQLGIPKTYGSYEELFADPEIDAIYNPLPNHMHLEWTAKALEAGKHVLSEKPSGLNAAEAEEMAAVAKRYPNLKLMEAFMYRFHPQWQRTKQLVDDGALGELRAVQAWFSYFNDDPHNIRNVAEFGGGALMDIGCYPISVARWLFDAQPDAVQALMHRDPSTGVDTLTSAALRFGTGQLTFPVSTQAEPYQRVHVVGTTGRIEIEIPFNAPTDRPTRILVTSGGRPPTDPATTVEEFAPVDQYALQADAFARAVIEGHGPPLPPDDAVANMSVIDAVNAAAT